MVTLADLKIGDVAWIDGREHTFAGYVRLEASRHETPDGMKFEDTLNGVTWMRTLEEFEESYSERRIAFPKPYQHPRDDPPEEDAPDMNKRRIRQRYLEAFDAAPTSRSTKSLKAFVDAVAPSIEIDHVPPSAGSLRRWLATRGEPGDRRLRFMSDRLARGRRPMRIDAVAQATLQEVAMGYWGNVRVTSSDIYNATRVAIGKRNEERRKEGLPPTRPPSRATVWRYVTSHSDYANTRKRLGDRVASRMFKSVKGSMETSRLLEIAIIDHTVLDCAVVDDETLMNVGRPYLTVLIDVFTRYPLAFYLSFEPPSVLSAMACLRRAVRPKNELKRLYPEIIGKWEAYGVPSTIVADNAWEFTKSSFPDACADAGISLEFAPIATPQYKAIGERFFGTMNALLIHKLPGSVPFSPQRRKELGIDPKIEAVLPLSVIERLIYQAIIEVYGNEVHRTLDAQPARLWREQAAKHGVRIAEDLEALDRGLSRLGPTRSLSLEGVEFEGLTYRSRAVDQLLLHCIPIEKKRGQRANTAKVRIKYHPEDLSEIFVHDPITRKYVALPCIQADYARGLSVHLHAELKKFAKANHLKFQSEDDRCAARVRLQDAIRTLLPVDKVRTLSRAQRLKGTVPVLIAGDDVTFGAQREDHSSAFEVKVTSPRSRAAPGPQNNGLPQKRKNPRRANSAPPPATRTPNKRRPNPANQLMKFDPQALLAKARAGNSQ